MEALARHCPSLTSLDLHGCFNVTDAGVVALAHCCSGLADLDLAGCRRITDEALVGLGSAQLPLVRQPILLCQHHQCGGGSVG